MYYLEVEAEFSAALYLSNCSDKYRGMHGHDFIVSLVLKSNNLHYGMVYDYDKILNLLNKVTETVNFQLLNDNSYFMEKNPTLENMAKYFYDQLVSEAGDLPVYEVKIKQTKGFSATFRPQV